jgi:hypothetical protein
MKKSILIIALVLSTSTLQAYNSKGMKVYKKMCLSCHGSPYRGAKMHTVFEWTQIYKESGLSLSSVHKDEPQAQKVLSDSYFTKKKQTYLKKFLLGNAKDAGGVPGCDGNYCGS